MADKRISALTEKTSLGTSDYFVTDNASEAASKKVKTSYITDQLTDMQNIYGAKNFVPYDYLTEAQAVNGITITPNGDGTYTLNGTATAYTDIRLTPYGINNYDKEIVLPLGDYLLTGKQGSGNSYGLAIVYVTSSSRDNLPGSDTGSGYSFTHSDATRHYEVKCFVQSGTTLNNVIIKPMIRLASIKDDTYVPYAKTNKEITDELGSTDISSIGNGTVTGGISSLNSALTNLVHRQIFTVTTNGNGNASLTGLTTTNCFIICTYSADSRTTILTYKESDGVNWIAHAQDAISGTLIGNDTMDIVVYYINR